MERRFCAESLVFLLLALSSCHTPSRLQKGDLLFHYAAEVNNITEVTSSMVDHVAIYAGGDSVIEAIGQGVVMTHVDTLLSRESGYYVVARPHSADADRSVARARAYLGLPYDHLFLPGDSAVYCSELVLLAFVDRRDSALFMPVPMSFHDESGRITDFWRQHYARHGMEVPEGWPGSNPSELSRRTSLKIMGKVPFRRSKARDRK